MSRATTVSFEQGRAEIAKLAEYFATNRTTFLGYREADARQTLIDPLFMALGWDVRNDNRAAPQYREVIPEESLDVEGHRRAPDYTFRVGQTPKFYAEAKRPGAGVKDDPAPAYQLRRYSWSAKLPLSILTSFDQFAVYDCRIRPSESDKASKARIWHYRCEDYADRWREIWDVFSREAVWGGSFDQFIETQRGKRGTSEVDSEFLKEIEGWRDLLARNIALRNPGVSQRDLNFAVQRTIDRIVFLRICEDRGIETYGTLQAVSNGEAIYRRLGEVFRRADDRYNSGLFYFNAERDRGEPPDEMTLGLTLDDNPLRDMLRSLYYPESPYEFSVLPAEILGQVYEQFLGKVIRLTKGGQAKVEEKPEVRKAGGVYYTPAYIVDYIVQNTVGKLLEGKTPKQASRLRVVDPACGSGSFLIGAYRYLLDWHRDRYLEGAPERHARGRSPALYEGAGGQWRLTPSEKKRILLNNIYGVDIDAQAVEVTKLSLLLKVLEGESDATISNQLRLLHERALPDLAGNIKCGNSLIGPDYYEGRQMNMLDEDERWRVNIFDWQAEFPEIIKRGGFDAVIGNPPWVMAGYYAGSGLEYLKRRYASAEGKFDLYYLFVELGTRVLSKTGWLGMIVPNKFFHTRAARSLRARLSASRAIHALIDFGYEKIFAGATNYSCIMLLRTTPARRLRFARALADLSITQSSQHAWSHFGDAPWHFAEPRVNSVFKKMEQVGRAMETIVERFGTGVQTGADKILILAPRNWTTTLG